MSRHEMPRQENSWDAFWRNDIEQLDSIIESNDCLFDKNPLYGLSMLDFAVLEDNLHKVEYLIRRGFNINRKNNMGRTPIMLAVLGDNVPIVKALVDANAHLEWRDPHGCTALMYTIFQSRGVEMATLLLERGADVTVTDNEGRTLGDKWKRWQPANVPLKRLLSAYGAIMDDESHLVRRAALVSLVE